jgi:hypothetical protein
LPIEFSATAIPRPEPPPSGEFGHAAPLDAQSDVTRAERRLSDDDGNRTVDTNRDALVRITKAAVAYMEPGGSIICQASRLNSLPLVYCMH